MSVLVRQGCFGPEEVAIASEAFSRSWSFVERDPILENCDRQKLEAELARGILETLKTGERNLLRISNRAIHRLRERTPRLNTHRSWKAHQEPGSAGN